MSWAEDNGIDIYDPDLFYDPYDFTEYSNIWVTKKGEVLTIVDMTDSHLLNAYKYANRKIEADSNDNMIDIEDNTYSYELHPWYDKVQIMEAELIKRGLLK